MPFTMTLGVGLGDLIPVGRMPRSWRSWASPRLILKVVVQLALFLLGGASVIDTDGRGVPPYLKAEKRDFKHFARTELSINMHISMLPNFHSSGLKRDFDTINKGPVIYYQGGGGGGLQNSRGVGGGVK